MHAPRLCQNEANARDSIAEALRRLLPRATDAQRIQIEEQLMTMSEGADGSVDTAEQVRKRGAFRSFFHTAGSATALSGDRICHLWLWSHTASPPTTTHRLSANRRRGCSARSPRNTAT